MLKILIGTTNKAKLNEYKYLFSFYAEDKIKAVGVSDLKGTVDSPSEKGNTLCDNAKTKSVFYAKHFKVPVLSDDGGLFIDALDGQPGVKSHRWVGYEADDETLINYTLLKLKGIPIKDRTAQMRVCLYFSDPFKNVNFSSSGTMAGFIAKAPTTRRVDGFPYRSLFVVSSIKRYYDELGFEEHLRFNHRFKAFKKFINKLRSFGYFKSAS